MTDIPTRFLNFYRGFQSHHSLTFRIALTEGYRLRPHGFGERPLMTVVGPYQGVRARLTSKARAGALRLGLPGGRDSRHQNTTISPDSDIPIVWETAENRRVPVEPWSLSLSFDLDDYGGTNLYAPYWWFSTDVFGTFSGGTFGEPISVQQLTTDRAVDQVPAKFCAAFMRNPEPLRLRMLEELGRIGPVDVFGAHTGRHISHKRDLKDHYKFILAFENDIFPGYITEKLPEAWACGAIPLWNGLDVALDDFNESSFLRKETNESVVEFGERVRELHEDEDRWIKAARQALLRRPPNVSPVRQSVAAVCRRAVELQDGLT